MAHNMTTPDMSTLDGMVAALGAQCYRSDAAYGVALSAARSFPMVDPDVLQAWARANGTDTRPRVWPPAVLTIVSGLLSELGRCAK